MYQVTTATRRVGALRKRIRGIQGGTSASKTISILLVLINRAQTPDNGSKELTSIVSESIPHLKRGAIRDFKNIMMDHRYWKDENWNVTDSIYTFETGNQIEFFSSENGDKLRGARRDWLFINEANNIAFEAFEQLEVRTKKGIYLDWNPSNTFWFYEEVLGKRDDVDHIILTYKDNESLDQAIVASIEQRRNRLGWWKVYGEGQLGEVEGKIYKGWQIVDDIPHEARLVRRGLDFGYSNDPTVIQDIYQYNGGYIVDEIVSQKGMSNRQIVEILQAQENNVLVVADSAEPKSIDEIKSYGIMIVGCAKGAGSVSNGIQYVQDQKVSMTKRSINTIKSYRNYMWDSDKDGRILNVPNHDYSDEMDAIRYGIAYNVKYQKPSEVLPVEVVEEIYPDIYG